MILILAGTSEGRQLAEVISGLGYPLLVTAVTDYGAKLAGETPHAKEILAGELTADDLDELITKRAVKAVIDATHPFAKAVSSMAMEVCRTKEVPYLRFERANTELQPNSLIYRVTDFREAALKAAALAETIFVTTGTRSLEDFLTVDELRDKRVVVRVLPEPESLQKCKDLGLLPRDIAAIQGPFTEELNRAMFASFGAGVIVTKESGKRGGTDTKIKAAMGLGLPVVVIERPLMKYFRVTDELKEVLNFIKEVVG